MNYEDLSGEIPLASIVEALDDNGDGEADADAWQAVQASAEQRIADAFGGSVPTRWANAADYARKVFLCEILFRRRGLTDSRNPYTAQASKAEDRLRQLAAGENAPAGDGGGEIFYQDAKVANTQGLMA